MKKKKSLTEILGWATCLTLAFAGAFVINKTVIANAVVISASMENTIMTDSRVMGLRIAYFFNGPHRFDIILFTPPDDLQSVPYVKRVIGLPGEKVEIRDGKVYIDDFDVPLEDSFIRETARGNYGPFNVPDGCYFVLGDNRNNSFDSKNWVNTCVPENLIIGKVYFEYWPSLGMLK